MTNSSRSCRKSAMLNISYCTWEKLCVCAVFAVQGVLGGILKKKKIERIARTDGDLQDMTSFSQFQEIMSRKAKNLAGVLSFF